MNTVVQILDAISDPAARTEPADAQLLDRFARLRDPDAFAALVRRHGPMVLGVCRRVLRNAADADDAFQAAFLVLARKAGRVGKRHRLAQWLYGVAFNTARKLRHVNARRAARLTPLADAPEPPAPAPDGRDELLTILDEEVSRLPERYKAVVVLCDLEGLTRREAARLLACPEGTVAGRLARARALLATRLTARGFGSAAALLAVVLAERAAVAASAVTGVVRAVGVDTLADAAARGLITNRVAETTEGVLRVMFQSKIRTATAAILCAGLMLACAAGLLHVASAQPAEQPLVEGAPPTDKPAPVTPPAKAPPEKAGKVPTVIPLKKLDAKATAEKLSKLLPDAVTVAAVRDENVLLVYATPKDTETVRVVLGTLGEDVPKGAAAPVPPAVEKKYTVRFEAAKWADVLDWYARVSGLTLVSNMKPTGTLTLKTPAGKEYTLAEVTDLLNEALAQQGFILMRREKTFILHPADEKIDPTFVPRVELKELPSRGRTELVEVQIPLTTLDAADVKDDVRKLLSPFGEVVVAKGKLLVVRDTAGNVDRLVRLLDGVNELCGDALTHRLRNAKAAEVAETLKTLLADKPEPGRRVAKVLIAVDEKTNSVLVTGPPDKIALAKKILEDLDKPAKPGDPPVPPAKLEPGPQTYDFRMKDAPWKDVMKWYAGASGLTANYAALPKGTFSYTPPMSAFGPVLPDGSLMDMPLTLAEVTDVINDALLKQKWLLVRGEKSFAVVPADEKIDPKLVRRVPVNDLGACGKTELVEVVITLRLSGPDFKPLVPAADLLPTAKRMLGPFGHAERHYYTGSQDDQLLVRDVAANVVKIVMAVRDIEEAEAKKRK